MTILFIHGLFMNPKSWAPWMQHFEALGYTCHAPAFQFHDGNPADLRRKPDPGLGILRFGDVLGRYVHYIDSLPEKPILIGHSVGGLLVQKLMELGKGEAGVCIHPAPPAGVITFKWSFWKANFPVVNPFKGNSTFLPSVAWYHYAFCNTMSLAETQAAYEQFVVPESRNIPRSILTDKAGRIDFKKPHGPLLFIAGDKDNITPSSLNLSNFKAYKHPGSVRAWKEFAGRTHYTCGQPGWEEVAGYIQGWLKGL